MLHQMPTAFVIAGCYYRSNMSTDEYQHDAAIVQQMIDEISVKNGNTKVSGCIW